MRLSEDVPREAATPCDGDRIHRTLPVAVCPSPRNIGRALGKVGAPRSDAGCTRSNALAEASRESPSMPNPLRRCACTYARPKDSQGLSSSPLGPSCIRLRQRPGLLASMSKVRGIVVHGALCCGGGLPVLQHIFLAILAKEPQHILRLHQLAHRPLVLREGLPPSAYVDGGLLVAIQLAEHLFEDLVEVRFAITEVATCEGRVIRQCRREWHAPISVASGASTERLLFMDLEGDHPCVPFRRRGA